MKNNLHEKYIFKSACSKMLIFVYVEYTDFQGYIKNNFIIDWAESTDRQDCLEICFNIDYVDCADIQLYVKNNIDHPDYAIMKDYCW